MTVPDRAAPLGLEVIERLRIGAGSDREDAIHGGVRTMVACADIRALLADHERLSRFMVLLEPDVKDREVILSKPEFWAADYRNAMDKLAVVAEIETRANVAAMRVERLRRLIEALKAETCAILEAKPE